MLSRESKELIPNWITTGRLFLVCPVLVVLLPYRYFTAAILVSIVGFVSDWLDGYLARKWRVISVWGSKWDPVADKLSTWPILIFGVCWYHTHPQWLWYCIAASIIATYDFAVTRVLWKLRGGEVQTNMYAKYKTTCLMIGLVATLVGAAVAYWMPAFYLIVPFVDALAMLLVVLASALAILSGVDYALQYGRASTTQPAE